MYTLFFALAYDLVPGGRLADVQDLLHTLTTAPVRCI